MPYDTTTQCNCKMIVCTKLPYFYHTWLSLVRPSSISCQEMGMLNNFQINFIEKKIISIGFLSNQPISLTDGSRHQSWQYVKWFRKCLRRTYKDIYFYSVYIDKTLWSVCWVVRKASSVCKCWSWIQITLQFWILPLRWLHSLYVTNCADMDQANKCAGLKWLMSIIWYFIKFKAECELIVWILMLKIKSHEFGMHIALSLFHNAFLKILWQ